MKAKRQKESGNAFIYILIAVALFAALTMTLSRQTDTGEAGTLSNEKAELLATQLITYAGQVRSAFEQLEMIVTTPVDQTVASNLDFTLPTAAGFNTGTHTYKVYHPQGMGINLKDIPEKAIAQVTTDPPAGWYFDRFENADWTTLGQGNTDSSTGGEAPWEEVLLVAYQIDQKVCQQINLLITGSTTIPVMDEDNKVYLINDSQHTGINTEFFQGECTPNICDDYRSICIQGNTDGYAFYSIIAEQ